ncbi:hypothetical protein SAMN05444004_12011 [Jannaschia faecimaris]|uniref:Uncharacterized protein n=1 Tax=Jannaschia faecimaris TaxID=1244108 RepID=A0A1H3TV56_9RHOB|nr:hypothetical protein SAMN05444004_12011 [Jannaschia faecimaris]
MANYGKNMVVSQNSYVSDTHRLGNVRLVLIIMSFAGRLLRFACRFGLVMRRHSHS